MGHSASEVLGGDSFNAEFVKNNGPFRGIISGASIKEFTRDDGRPEKRLAISIELETGDAKSLTLNKTNTKLLAAAYGDDTDAWADMPVIIDHDPAVQYAGKMVGGIRVRVPRKAKAAPAAAPPAAPAATDDDDIPF
jgi:hypothetical protein